MPVDRYDPSDPYDLDPQGDDDDFDDEPEDDEWGCCFPGQCCMPADHMKSECHTAEMMEEIAREHDPLRDALRTLKEVKDANENQSFNALNRSCAIRDILLEFSKRHPDLLSHPY